MSAKFEVRPYRPGDENEVVRLLGLVFDGWPHFDIKCDPIDHWRWKYRDYPTGKIICTLAESDGRIIGCFHSPLLEVKIGGSTYLCSQGADQAVHPDFRRMGVYTKTREMAQKIRMREGVKFHFSGSIVQIMIETSMKRGESRFPHDGRVFVRIHDVDEHFRKMPAEKYLLNKYGFLVLRLVNRIRNALQTSRLLKLGLVIREIERFDDRINDFWEKISKNYYFIVKRTRDYLNWRYCDPRAGDFIVKLVEEDDEILGYIVLRINRFVEDYPVGWLVDLLTLPDRLDAAYALVEDAVKYFDQNDININICLINMGHPHEEIMKRYGFLNSRQGPFRVYVSYLRGSENIGQFEESRVNEVHNVFGDHDWI